MPKKYVIAIEETLRREIVIEAENGRAALDKAEEMHRNEEIVLDSTDYIGGPEFYDITNMVDIEDYTF